MICCSLLASSLDASMLLMLRATRSFHGSVADNYHHHHEEEDDDDDADDAEEEDEKEC